MGETFRKSGVMRWIVFLISFLLAAPAQAQDAPVEVDLELVLMADVSRSMSPAELEIQRRGYWAALRSDQVFAAIRSGMLGTIALTYVEWAGTHHVVVDWRLIETREQLDEFADELIVTYNPGLRLTSITNALELGKRMIETNEFIGLRRVIDISGDGPNNEGGLVTLARDAAIANGIVINGLPLMTRDGVNDEWYLAGLDIYYQTCVIGGPGSFVLPVLDWADFEQAVRRKLVMEIAGLFPPTERLFRAQASPHDPTDCRIGEKIWAQRRGMMGGFGTP